MTTKEFAGVCSTGVSYEVDEDGLVQKVSFTKGCGANLQAVARLSEGRPVAEVVSLLQGITCGRKATSCPDQFAQVLLEQR